MSCGSHKKPTGKAYSPDGSITARAESVFIRMVREPFLTAPETYGSGDFVMQGRVDGFRFSGKKERSCFVLHRVRGNFPSGKDESPVKKLTAILLAFLLTVTLAAAESTYSGAEEADHASAGCTVVTALASEVNPEHLVSVAADVKVLSYADGQFTITVLVPERYDPEEIRALKIGDAIYTQGREIEVRSLSEQDGYLVLNADADDSVWLFESVDLNYWIMDVNDNTWTELATVTVPASGHFLFLDGIDPYTGESLLHPTVYNEEVFLTVMNTEEDPGFDIRNVEAVFDEKGELALIRRFYVPWQ